MASRRSLSTRRIRRSERKSLSRPGIASRTAASQYIRSAPRHRRVISAAKSSSGGSGPRSGKSASCTSCALELHRRYTAGRLTPAVVAIRSMVVAE